MEVNIKNKKYIYFKKSIIKLNDVSPSLINIIKEEYIGINTYHINYYYLDNDNKLKTFYFAINVFMDILKKIVVRNILILIILIIIKRF